MSNKHPGRPATPKDIRERFAANVRAAVDNTGETLSQISRRANLSYPSLGAWSRGTRIASGPSLKKLAEALHTTAKRLMRGVEGQAG